jgi:hypothetical protein
MFNDSGSVSFAVHEVCGFLVLMYMIFGATSCNIVKVYFMLPATTMMFCKAVTLPDQATSKVIKRPKSFFFIFKGYRPFKKIIPLLAVVDLFKSCDPSKHENMFLNIFLNWLNILFLLF